MKRIVYVNGQYVAEDDAKISIFDRGFLFSDAVYEVTAVINGKLLENEGHLARLKHSCEKLDITLPVSLEQITEIQNRLIKENNLIEGGIYLQISRGNAGDRDFHFPDKSVPATLVLFTQARAVIDNPNADHGIKAITLPEIRWHLRDIKVNSLLAACLAKEQAHQKSADDAIFIEDGYITEGSSSNAYIVKNNTIITRDLSKDILHGITRKGLVKLAKEHQIKLEERPFSIEELKSADEVFISSATAFVIPIIEIDGVKVNGGTPGETTQKLYKLYQEMALAETR